MSGAEGDRTLSRRFALLLEYDGTRFAGSQLQTDVVTVQSVIEDAIERGTERRSRVAFAGRTDAGTHARGQVASFSTTSRLDAATLRRALNAWLPADVAVLQAAEVGFDFDPRRDANERHYRYIVDNGETRPVLDRDRVWHVPASLDVPLMKEAARRLQGTHDFAAFAAPMESEDASTVRELRHFEVTRRGERIFADAVANSFLRHQVRRMVGALIEVGKGVRSPEEYGLLLQGPPASAGPSAPARGLYLMAVSYEPPVFETALDSDSSLC